MTLVNDPIHRIRVVAAVIVHDGRLLVCQRPPHKRHGGLWEFPGGKVEAGESDLTAVRRELREELDVDVVTVADEVFRLEDHGSEFTIAFIPTTIDGDPRAIEHISIAWADLAELSAFELAPTDRAFVTSLRRTTESSLGSANSVNTMGIASTVSATDGP